MLREERRRGGRATAKKVREESKRKGRKNSKEREREGRGRREREKQEERNTHIRRKHTSTYKVRGRAPPSRAGWGLA